MKKTPDLHSCYKFVMIDWSVIYISYKKLVMNSCKFYVFTLMKKVIDIHLNVSFISSECFKMKIIC